jgi:hypothetical protein
MRTIKLFLLLALPFFAGANLRAQVTIGGLTEPAAGAILDLNSTAKGGLLLSNVTITDWELIPQDANVFPGISDDNVNMDLRGAMVYNTGTATVPPGIYIWNGCRWTQDGSYGTAVTSSSYSVTAVDGYSATLTVTGSGCPTLSYEWFSNDTPSNVGGTPTGTNAPTFTTPALSYSSAPYYYYCEVTSSLNGSKAVSDVFTVSVNMNPVTLAAGSGTFAGRLCFDIATQNDNSTCGLLSNRSARSTDFSDRTVQNVTSPAPYSGVQEYVFTPLSGTVRNVRFILVEETGSSVESITPQGDYSGDVTNACTALVSYKSSLNTGLAGKTRDTGNKVKLHVVYNNGTEDKRLTLNISLQDCSCCDGAWVENGAWDYANGSSGAWAVGKTVTYTEQENTDVPLQNLNGAYNSTTAFDSYFQSASSGALCWYKKDASLAYTTTDWMDAVNNCANGTYADGDANGGWYLPNLKELDYLYRNLPDGSLGGSRVGTAAFFGGSSDAAPLNVNYYWSSTEAPLMNGGQDYYYNASHIFYFFSGGRGITNKNGGGGYVRCVRRF